MGKNNEGNQNEVLTHHQHSMTNDHHFLSFSLLSEFAPSFVAIKDPQFRPINMASILSLLGDALYSLNPSMLSSPPEGLTFGIGGQDEVCYRAPNGDETMCKDLPPGMAGTVGTWYLDPQQYILEGIVVSLACLGVIRFFLPRLSTIPSHFVVRHPKGVPLVAAISCLAILYFKYFAYLKKVLYFVMPCNMQWLLTALLCYGPKNWRPVILELQLSYLGGAFVALAVPDLADLSMFGELEFFFFNHGILPFIPLLYLQNGSFTTRTSLATHIGWWAIACGFFGIFYFTFVTLLAILSGLNLNYMLHPPPGQDLCIGEWFRIYSIGLLSLLFALSRLFGYVLEVALFSKKKTRKIE